MAQGNNMGKAPSIESLAQQDQKFQDYLAEITDDLKKQAANSIDQLQVKIDEFYSGNGWTSEGFIAGESFDFMQEAEWSAERLSSVIDTIASAIFGGTAAPEGIDITETQDISSALADMEDLQLYFASRVFTVLTGVLSTLGNSTTITYKTQYKTEPLGNGFQFFSVMACNSYESENFFGGEKIIEYLYAYQIRFSLQQAQSQATVTLLKALNDEFNAISNYMTKISDDFQKGDLSVDQWITLRSKLKAVQDLIYDEIQSVGSNQLKMAKQVAVPEWTFA